MNAFYTFLIVLKLAVGSPDGGPHEVQIRVQADSMSQCIALRRQAIRMLGGKEGDAKNEERISLCKVEL